MTRSRTFSPAAETTIPPRTFGSAAPRRSPPGPTSPASPWLHNRAYRRASLSPSRFPSICTCQVDGAGFLKADSMLAPINEVLFLVPLEPAHVAVFRPVLLRGLFLSLDIAV